MHDHYIHTFPNGISLVYKRVPNVRVVHCGFIMDIGSRDESASQQGIAHFWEHMAFKGTHKRKAFHILDRIDSVGGELNAYTTKEKICFYASLLDKHIERAFELLTDITFHSAFPERQMERERNVILEEMAMYKDNPEDAIQDEFDCVVFGDHPLGKNILGTPETIQTFKQGAFYDFISANLSTERTVFSCVGNLPVSKIERLATKYLNDLPERKVSRERVSFDNYVPQHRKVTREITQSQCMIGRTAYPIHDKRRIPLFLLINILGGPGLNSRLNLALREKYGFVYSIDAIYHPFSDTGLFSIYFGTEPRQLGRSSDLVKKELKKLQKVPLGAMQLHKAKEQIKGQLAMAEENNLSLMLMMGRSLLDVGKIVSLEELFNQIDQLKSTDLQEIAQDLFNEESLSTLKFIPSS